MRISLRGLLIGVALVALVARKSVKPDPGPGAAS